MNPVQLALGAGGTFVARSADRDQKLLRKLLVDAHDHKGFSLVHILQNCLIFNDATFEPYVGKEKAENTVILEHGEPMIFGKESDKAIILDNLTPKVVAVADVSPEQILRHNAHDENSLIPQVIASLPMGEFPMPMGIIRAVEKESYDDALQNQMDEQVAAKGAGDLQALLTGRDTWTIS